MLGWTGDKFMQSRSALTWTKLFLQNLEGSKALKRPVLGHGPESVHHLSKLYRWVKIVLTKMTRMIYNLLDSKTPELWIIIYKNIIWIHITKLSTQEQNLLECMEGKTVIHIDIYQVDSIPEPKVPYQLVMQKFFLLSDTLLSTSGCPHMLLSCYNTFLVCSCNRYTDWSNLELCWCLHMHSTDVDNNYQNIIAIWLEN